MLTSLFRRSTPFNYSLIIIAILAFFFIHHISIPSGSDSTDFVRISVALTVVFGSFFMLNFILKKNGLSRDSGFGILFYLVLLLFFPSVFSDVRLLVANFFVLLAMRRLISMTSPKSVREKIFDASLWIFIASLFHFWAIAYILMVFVSILFHVSRDYRNWVLPFIAFVGVAAIFGLYATAFDEHAFRNLLAASQLDPSVDYFTRQQENVAISVYAAVALFFLLSMLMTLSNRPLQLQSSFKKIIGWFVIGLAVFVFSPFKSNNLAIFTIAPLAIMATAYVEHFFQDTLKVEIALWLTTLCGIGLFFYQL